MPETPLEFLLIAAVLGICGVLLAFLGRKSASQYLSLIGSAIGGTVGFIIGDAISPGTYYLAIALAVVGLILGSLLLSYAPNAALAFFTGFLGAVVAYVAFGGTDSAASRGQEPPVMASLLVMVLVFAVVYYFIEELMVLITALIGGVLVGAGVFLATPSPQDPTYAGVALGAVFLLGLVVQYARGGRDQSRGSRAHPG